MTVIAGRSRLIIGAKYTVVYFPFMPGFIVSPMRIHLDT
jgi:hypothetical protein